MSTVTMQLNGKNSSTVNKSVDSCHNKKYTKNNISLYLILLRLGGLASYMAQEKNYTHAVMRL